MSFNKIIIVGYLGRDPELKYTPQGAAVCNFSVATTEKRKNREGDQEDVTTWFRVTAWGRQAEAINQYFAKGSLIYVEGRLRIEEYTSRDGEQRFSAEVNMSGFEFLGKTGQGESEAKPKAKAKAANAFDDDDDSGADPAPDDDDGIPF
jgi:single-strand DNA-binding protein